jgi:hypothetical protein
VARLCAYNARLAAAHYQSSITNSNKKGNHDAAIALLEPNCTPSKTRGGGYGDIARAWLLVRCAVLGLVHGNRRTGSSTSASLGSEGMRESKCMGSLSSFLGARIVKHVLVNIASAGDVQTLATLVVTLRSCVWTRCLLLTSRSPLAPHRCVSSASSHFETPNLNFKRHMGVEDGGATMASLHTSAAGDSSPNVDWHALGNQWIIQYSELLYQWGAYEARLEVLKFLAISNLSAELIPDGEATHHQNQNGSSATTNSSSGGGLRSNSTTKGQHSFTPPRQRAPPRPPSPLLLSSPEVETISAVGLSCIGESNISRMAMNGFHLSLECSSCGIITSNTPVCRQPTGQFHTEVFRDQVRGSERHRGRKARPIHELQPPSHKDSKKLIPTIRAFKAHWTASTASSTDSESNRPFFAASLNGKQDVTHSGPDNGTKSMSRIVQSTRSTDLLQQVISLNGQDFAMNLDFCPRSPSDGSQQLGQQMNLAPSTNGDETQRLSSGGGTSSDDNCGGSSSGSSGRDSGIIGKYSVRGASGSDGSDFQEQRNEGQKRLQILQRPTELNLVQRDAVVVSTSNALSAIEWKGGASSAAGVRRWCPEKRDDKDKSGANDQEHAEKQQRYVDLYSTVASPTGQVCCGQYSSVCSLCRLPVRGLFVLCKLCGHGGHAIHLRNWFGVSRNASCPAGCGCRCAINAI